jgi:hypothetical protein
MYQHLLCTQHECDSATQLNDSGSLWEPLESLVIDFDAVYGFSGPPPEASLEVLLPRGPENP